MDYINYMGDMSRVARATMNRSGIPEELRDTIMNQTPYGNTNANVKIEFLKECLGGEHVFSKIILLLTLPTYIISDTGLKKVFEYPSWLTDITDEYLNLLKSIQKLPNIFIPFVDIVNQYVRTKSGYVPKYTDDEFIELSSTIVSRFITGNNLDPTSPVAIKIKNFFDTVVNILLKVINDSSSKLNNNPQYILRARLEVKSKIEVFIHCLKRLITVNTDENNHKMIQRLDLKEILDYGKRERESDIEKLRKQNPKKYKNEESIEEGLNELYTIRVEERIERTRRRRQQSKGGRKKYIHSSSSRKKCNSKKRAYKKRSYKNKNI